MKRKARMEPVTTGHSLKVARHYNSIGENGLAARSNSRIFHMRNFNNWIKSVLISDILGRVREASTTSQAQSISVLDLGCGKGGDLLKWQKGHIGHLVCADIAEVSVQQCRSRYKEMERRNGGKIFGAKFIAADCTKDVLADDEKLRGRLYDVCSCQFVYHYSFESHRQADTMLRNACESLRPGGFFMGTTPDAFELMKRMESSDGLEFGNDLYSVRFDRKGEYPLFGCQYHFKLEGVVDVPEFLVYFPLLVEMAKKYGMSLVYRKTFAEFFEEKVAKRQHRDLLVRMMGLKSYPCERSGCPAATDGPGEYDHAEQHTSHTAGVRPPLGTLSKSEWEAISLYMVFAFQKDAVTTRLDRVSEEKKGRD